MKVVYTGCSDDQVLWGTCDDPRGIVEYGVTYEVLRTEEHSWHTKIVLVAFPNLRFNSVCFETVTAPARPSRRHTVVYIAGPYTGRDYIAVDENIANARRAMAQLVRLGYYVYCPHTHSAHFEVITPEVPIDFWYDFDLHWLQHCDALLRLSGPSRGADAEVALMRKLGRPVFDTIDVLAQMLPVWRVESTQS